MRFFQFCGNATHTITAFAQAESALHSDSIGIILILLFFINFCTKFNRCFDLTSDDRPEPWLRNTYNPMLHRMDSVIIHILLLFIQPDDGKIQTDSLTCHGITITHELFQIAKISFYVAKLSAECTADFLCRVLPALSKCKILFSGTFTVSSWQLKTITFTKTINHDFQLFSCIVQK